MIAVIQFDRYERELGKNAIVERVRTWNVGREQTPSMDRSRAGSGQEFEDPEWA